LVLPMSDFVRDMLVARRALGKDRFVFPSNGAKGHLAGLVRPFEKIAKVTGITISPHDLRRGYASIAESLDIPLTVIKQLLNHAPMSDVTGGYIIHDSDRLIEPVAKIAAKLLELCKYTAPDLASPNVVKLAKI
jgi:integrase